MLRPYFADSAIVFDPIKVYKSVSRTKNTQPRLKSELRASFRFVRFLHHLSSEILRSTNVLVHSNVIGKSNNIENKLSNISPLYIAFHKQAIH